MSNINLLLTGASSGVGFMLVNELIDKYNIITISRRTERLLNRFPNIDAYSCDLSDKVELNEVLDKIITKHGGCSYIINCAGVLDAGEIDLSKINEFQYSLDVNALAPMIVISKLIPMMKKNNFGRIINLTSGAPLNCFSGFACYSASKAALNSLTVTLAREVEGNNISVNLMSPGPVKSEMSPNATIEPKVCLPTVNYLLSGKGFKQHDSFFWLGYKIPLFPDLEGVNWLEGIGNKKIEKVILE